MKSSAAVLIVALRVKVFKKIDAFCCSWKVDRDACSAHCGRGTAKQYIACSLTTRYNTTLVDMKHCEKRISEIGPKPKDIVVCYGKCLETNWEYGEWTRVKIF